MAEALKKEIARKLLLEGDTQVFNAELTEKLGKEPKYVRFNQWAKENGAIMDSVIYPAAFGKCGLVGVAAARDIGPDEPYFYVPAKLLINDQKIKASEYGPIVEKNKHAFEEHEDAEYMRLIFFLACEICKGEDSFWAPYFEIAQATDLPSFWSDEELDQLEDALFVHEIKEYRKDYENEFEMMTKIVNENAGVIRAENWTREVFKKAFTCVVTRCFGWSMPSTMVVPVADNLNHFILDSSYELFQAKLHKQCLLKPKEQWAGPEKKYGTVPKMLLKFDKFYVEDAENVTTVEEANVPRTTKRYGQKLEMRWRALHTDLEAFKREETQVWDLPFIPTSEDEDNDSEEGEEQEEEQEEHEEEESKGEPKKKRKEHFVYTYGDGGEAKKVLKKVFAEDDKKPIVDLILDKYPEKKALEKTMIKLKQEGEEEIFSKVEHLESSEEDDEEDFSWWTFDDPDMYFVIGSKYKNIYKQHQQMFHCYGRRTNRFLLMNYGFCLRFNKYNSVNFRVYSDLSQRTDIPEEDKISNLIRLKKNRIQPELFTYLRGSLYHKFTGANKEEVLFSQPVDYNFEIMVVACVIQMLGNLTSQRFSTSYEADVALLKQYDSGESDLSMRGFWALMHRLGAKEILAENIKLCKILLRILNRVREGAAFRAAYLERVEEQEAEGEVIPNRLKLRYYLRDLYINRLRINDTRVMGFQLVDAGGFQKIDVTNPEKAEDIRAIEELGKMEGSKRIDKKEEGDSSEGEMPK